MTRMHAVFAIVLAISSGETCSATSYAVPKIDPEVDMNTTQLITSKGYPCEDYDVHTSDGYILSVQRIPRGKNDHNLDGTRPAVLLQHGLLSCSACWVENLVNESLGFILADAGYDVWLGNSRGNTYGKRHEKLSPKSPEFWKFSWDEMALYDIPATIEKILEVSGQSQIFYVGHSQGGGIAFAALSKIPNLAAKIKLFVPLAPAVYIEAMKSPLRLLVPYANELEKLADLLGIGELLPNDFVSQWLAKDVCDKEIPAYLCENFLFILCGFDEKQMNVSRLPVYIGQHPAGTSTQNVIHFAQMIKTGQFQMFDFGPEGNMKKYNQSTPPMYDLGQVTTPVAMFSGTDDWLVGPNDIMKLSMQIKIIVQNKVLSGWEHLDFIWALDAPGQCYNDILELLKKYA